jgi:hypothetical protein
MGVIKLESMKGATFHVIEVSSDRLILEQDNGGVPGDIYLIEAKIGAMGGEFAYLEAKKT